MNDRSSMSNDAHRENRRNGGVSRGPRVRRVTTLASAALLGWLCSAAPAGAQECEGGLPPYGGIGVDQFECVGASCALFMRNGDPYGHSFATEPRLRRIDPDGPSAGRIREGDILVAVDDLLITTADGGRRLGSLKPGQPVELTLRRGRQELDVVVTPEASCQFSALMIRSGDRSAWAYGRGVPQRGWTSGDSVYFATGDSIHVMPDRPPRGYTLVPSPTDSARWRAFATPISDLPVPGAAIDRGFIVTDSLRGGSYTVTGGWEDYRDTWLTIQRANARFDSLARLGRLRPPAEFGVELRCGDCGFRMRDGNVVFETEQFPIVVSIERSGPADQAGMLVGDILLTVGDRAITSGRALGALRVGRPVKVEVRRGDRIVELTITPRGPSSPRQRW